MNRADSAAATRVAAIALLALLTALWAIWAWQEGAYFETTFYPGLIVLAGLVALLLVRGPGGVPLRGIVRAGFLALLALAGLTLLSVLWSPTPGIPLEDAQQVLGYALAFLLGVWLCRLLRRRMELALLPVAAAAGAVGLVTLAVIWTGHNGNDYLTADGTLRWPLGYRNAVAGYFLIGLWPAIALAKSADLDWRLRGAMLATATLSLELAVLCQSRGSALAAIVGLLAYLALGPGRWKAFAYLLLAAIPAALALPFLLDVFSRVDGGGDAIAALRPAARAIAATTTVSLLVGWVAARSEHRLLPDHAFARRASRIGTVAVAAAALIAVVLAVRAVGDPVDWIDHRAAELRAGTPDFQTQGTRFGINAGSNRGDFWSVAWGQGRAHPALGRGAGGFQVAYLQERDSSEAPSDPHSVELLMFSELGIAGFALFALVCVGFGAGGLRTRGLGPSAATLVTGALAAAAYWLAHASIDWLWNYPALTAPVFMLLGAACAPALLDPEAAWRAGRRRWLMIGLAVATVLAGSAYLSQSYVDNANEEWRGSLSDAYSDLDRAQTLAPLDERPALSEAVIARAAGDPVRALAAAREVVDRQPDSWAGHLLIGELLAGQDPAAARAELERAIELNPDDPRAHDALAALDG